MATYTLLLPGTILNLSNLLVKKFAGKSNKEGAVETFKQLEETGLGKIVETKAQRGTACVSAQRGLWPIEISKRGR